MDKYGSLGTEIKYHVYVGFTKDNKAYKVKVDFMNTTCVLGVDSIKENNADEVEGRSVSEFFVENYIMKVVEVIKSETDLIELNKRFKELSKLGLQSLSKRKQFCFDCEKEVKEGSNLKCLFCKKIVHGNCGLKKLKKDLNKSAGSITFT